MGSGKRKNEYIEHFLAYLEMEKRVSRNTLITYHYDMIEFGTWVNTQKINIRNASLHNLKNYFKYLYDRNQSTATRTRKIYALRSFYSFMHIKYRSKDYAQFLILPQQQKKLPRYINEAELRIFFKVLDKNKRCNAQRDRALFYVLYSAGLRISELLNLKKSNVISNQRALRIEGKGAKERLVPLPERVMELLHDYIKNKPPYGYLFESNYRESKKLTRQAVHRTLKELWKKTKILKPINLHQFRHSLATHLYKKGVNLRTLQVLLGHSFIQTVQIYTHLDTTHLRREYNRAHPRAK